MIKYQTTMMLKRIKRGSIMRKIPPLFFLISIIMIIAVPIVSSAASRTVTINWSVSNTADIQSYKMYYSYDSGMSNKQFLCATSNPNAISLTCENVDINTYPVYFTIAAVTPNGEINSPPDSVLTPMTMVQNFSVVTPSNTTPPAPDPTPGTLLYAINFQPANAPIPDGFSVDSGGSYSTNSGYGWTTSPGAEGPRDRDMSESPNQSYDTLLLVDQTGTWELAVEQGTYIVTICVGDPWWAYSTNIIHAEGVQIVNDTVTSEQKWLEKTKIITINDGRLTVTFQGSTPHSQLCWIKISSQQ